MLRGYDHQPHVWAIAAVTSNLYYVTLIMTTRIMSQTPPMATSSSNYQSIFDNALESYKKRTGKDLASDPILRRLETCHSPDDVLVILRGLILECDQSRSSNSNLTKWLNPTVNVLYTLSTTIGEGVGLVSTIDLANLGFVL
jgi:hypothetical protein